MVLRRGQGYRTLDARIALYDLVQGLRKQGLSYKQIQETVSRETGSRFSKGSISYWIRGIHRPIGSLNPFSPEPSPELSYVIGVGLSDGNVNLHDYHYEILLSVTDKDFAEEFARCLGRVLGRKGPYKVRWRAKRKNWVVQGSSVLFHKFFSSNLSSLRRWIEHCQGCESAFLRAFYDGEGSISERNLILWNTNSAVLLYIQNRLKNAGISTTSLRLGTRAGTVLKDPVSGRTYIRKKDCFYFRVRAQSLLKFCELVGFTIERKQRRLYQASFGR